MVYAIVVGFALLCGGGAVLVLLLGWKSEEMEIQTHMSVGTGLHLEPHVRSIDEIQDHIDAELVGIDEFAAHPSAKSLYAVKEGAASAA